MAGWKYSPTQSGWTSLESLFSLPVFKTIPIKFVFQFCVLLTRQMRALLLHLLLVAVDASGFTANEACHFVGSRFARSNSTCDMGVCSNLVKHPSGAYVRVDSAQPLVRCTDAQVDAATFLREQAVPARRSKRRKKELEDSEGVITAFELNVVPVLAELAFGINVYEEIVDRALSSFDRLVMSRAAENIEIWKESTARIVVEAVRTPRMTQIYTHIIGGCIQRSLAYPALRRSLKAAVQFYFDFAAVLGSHFLTPELLQVTPVAMGRTDRGYRPHTRWEVPAAPDTNGVPRTSEGVIRVSEVLDLLAEPRAELSASGLATLYNFMAGWSLSPQSASKGLFRDQIRASICHRLPALVSELASRRVFSEALVRVIVGLIDECRPVLPMVLRRNVRDLLAQWGQRALNTVPLPAEVSIEWLLEYRPQVAWYMGLSCPDSQIRAQTILRDFLAAKVILVDEAGQRQSLTFLDNQPATLRGFGRALGLAILHGVDLQFLQLTQAFAKLLNPRFRQEAKDLATIAFDIAPMTPNGMMSVSSGLEEVLGRGGHEMFSLREWLAIFGLTE